MDYSKVLGISAPVVGLFTTAKAEYKKDIEKLKNPENINEAVYASSPYVLRKAFDSDETLHHLIKGGSGVIPLISEEMQKNGTNLSDITLAAFAYVLEKIDAKEGVRYLEPIYAKSLENPGPFFVNFAAHAINIGSGSEIKPMGAVYSKPELLEALEVAKRYMKDS